eukprot:scaffold2214_cov139-Cylindrotheca_fusiformis.AAC.2
MRIEDYRIVDVFVSAQIGEVGGEVPKEHHWLRLGPPGTCIAAYSMGYKPYRVHWRVLNRFSSRKKDGEDRGTSALEAGIAHPTLYTLVVLALRLSQMNGTFIRLPRYIDSLCMLLLQLTCTRLETAGPKSVPRRREASGEVNIHIGELSHQLHSATVTRMGTWIVPYVIGCLLGFRESFQLKNKECSARVTEGWHVSSLHTQATLGIYLESEHSRKKNGEARGTSASEAGTSHPTFYTLVALAVPPMAPPSAEGELSRFIDSLYIQLLEAL